jgi:hypothetical protein
MGFVLNRLLGFSDPRRQTSLSALVVCLSVLSSAPLSASSSLRRNKDIYAIIETFTEFVTESFSNTETFSNLVVRFMKSFTNLVGVGLSVLLLIWFVEIMNHKNRATESFSSSETSFSNKSVKVSKYVPLCVRNSLGRKNFEFQILIKLYLLFSTKSPGEDYEQ